MAAGCQRATFTKQMYGLSSKIGRSLDDFAGVERSHGRGAGMGIRLGSLVWYNLLMKQFPRITFDPAVMGGAARDGGDVLGLPAANRWREEILWAYPYLEARVSMRRWLMRRGRVESARF